MVRRSSARKRRQAAAGSRCGTPRQASAKASGVTSSASSSSTKVHRWRLTRLASLPTEYRAYAGVQRSTSRPETNMTEVRPSALTSRMKSAGPTLRPKTKTPLAKNACSASQET
eukprot:scaffold101501_cov42-Phaeocystis_antarctica.AAC.1